MNFIKEKIRCVFNCNCRFEIVGDSFVDKDVQSMLLPLNLTQILFFCPKYRIRDNFISPNSCRSCLMSLCGTIIFISFFFYRLYRRIFNEQLSEYYKYDYNEINYFDFIFTAIGFLINFFAVIYQTKENVVFVLKFLYIHRVLNNKTTFKHFIVGNWLSVISILVTSTIIALHICISLKLPFHNILCGLVVISFDTNIVYAIRLIKLLKHKVDLWNIKTLNFQSLGDRDGEAYCNRLYQAFVYMLECYDICKASFQQMIVFHCMSSFCKTLIHLHSALENGKYASQDHLFLIWIINTWLAKSLLLETILSVEFEKFYIALNKVQDTCAVLLNSNCTDEEKRLYKNIKRLHETTFDKMDACGMFYVDATLPLEMMALITNYTIVILQFAVL